MCASNPQPNESKQTIQKGLAYWLSTPFVWLIRAYQLIISPWLGNKCRYTPTCSQYGIQAFQKHGPLKGFWLTLKRVMRCHPWGGHGHDPVP